jgi:thymidylate synthase (FAD)
MADTLEKDNIVIVDDKADLGSLGYMELMDSMGGDLSIVNSARVSYNKYSVEFEEKDNKLINYL